MGLDLRCGEVSERPVLPGSHRRLSQAALFYLRSLNILSFLAQNTDKIKFEHAFTAAKDKKLFWKLVHKYGNDIDSLEEELPQKLDSQSLSAFFESCRLAQDDLNQLIDFIENVWLNVRTGDLANMVMFVMPRVNIPEILFADRRLYFTLEEVEEDRTKSINCMNIEEKPNYYKLEEYYTKVQRLRRMTRIMSNFGSIGLYFLIQFNFLDPEWSSAQAYAILHAIETIKPYAPEGFEEIYDMLPLVVFEHSVKTGEPIHAA